MAKELLIYGSIDAFTSSQFIDSFNMLNDPQEDISVRINCNGGNPEYGWGMVAKFAEYSGKKLVKVDGKAYSFGLCFLCYADDAEALDVSEFLLHRAAYSEWFEKSEFFTESIKSNLERINKSLRKAFENKVDVELFEKLTNQKLDSIFSMDSRIDVTFDANVAKKIGLIKRINKITPQKKAEISASMVQIAAHHGIEIDMPVDIPQVEKPKTEEPIIKENNSEKMTTDKLKAENPAIYNEILALGAKQEKDRVEAYLVFAEVDPKAVFAGIQSGEPMSQKQMAEFSLKAVNPEALKKLEKEAPAAVKTEEPTGVKTEKEAQIASFTAEVKKELEITK